MVVYKYNENLFFSVIHIIVHVDIWMIEILRRELFIFFFFKSFLPLRVKHDCARANNIFVVVHITVVVCTTVKCAVYTSKSNYTAVVG